MFRRSTEFRHKWFSDQISISTMPLKGRPHGPHHPLHSRDWSVFHLTWWSKIVRWVRDSINMKPTRTRAGPFIISVRNERAAVPPPPGPSSKGSCIHVTVTILSGMEKSKQSLCPGLVHSCRSPARPRPGFPWLPLDPSASPQNPTPPLGSTHPRKLRVKSCVLSPRPQSPTPAGT